MLSKLVTQLLMPLGVGGLGVLVGVIALVLGHRVSGSALALAGLAWIWLWATPAASDWLRGSLEHRYPPTAVEALPKAPAMVLLGGGMDPVTAPRLHPDLGSAADRVWHAARVFHAGKAPLVVVSGGALPWHAGDGVEADAMLTFLGDLDVPAERVVLEGRSGTTRGNAVETAALLAERGIDRVLLVTSALHMRRAEATFRAVGLDVVPVATDYEIVDSAETPLEYLPDADALYGSSRAIKEYLGLAYYRLRGWAR
ncbi:MAG: YdcF family protein [Thiohalocapsa sp.]|nr:YdcF family protein [Thiohalocapsa sp.]